jgi:uncharacterized protein (TIGR02996 family)
MPTAKDFLEAIIANPDDDGPRLLYADWLDEHGDAARAELIRVQIELARLDEDDKNRVVLEGRDDELLRAHGEAWLDEIAPGLGPIAASPRRYHQFDTEYIGAFFERGMLERVNLYLGDMRPHLAAIFRRSPIREVCLMSLARDEVRSLAALPWPRQLTTFELIESDLSASGMMALVAAPFIAKLRELRFARNNIGSRGVAALTRCTTARFSTLTLDDENVDAAGVEALSNWDRLFGLETLEIACNPLGDHGIRQLTHSPHLRSLRALDLSSTECGATGAGALAQSPVVESLTTLVLNENRLGAEGAAVLASSPRLACLKSLQLWGNGIGDEGARAIATSPHLAKIADLELTKNGLTEIGLSELTRTSRLPAVQVLALTWNDLNDGAVRVLARWPGLSRLKSLDLRHNQITDEGARELAASPYVDGVRAVDLSYNHITEKGAAAVKAAGRSNVIVRFQREP